MNALANLELRIALRSWLLADAGLAGVLAGGKVYDEAPPSAQPPYITLTNLVSRDWSTCTEDGALHDVTLDVWSSHRGSAEALTMAGQVAVALDDAPLPISGHALISLSVQSIETSREAKGRFARARLRLRAVTEPL